MSDHSAYPLFAPGLWRVRSVLWAALLIVTGLAMLGPNARASRPNRARPARTLKVTDTAHMRLLRSSGAQLIEEGPVSGTLPGTAKINFEVGPTVTGRFTIYARGGGSISGHGSATLHSSGLYASFGGSMSVSHGSGRYAHAHGDGGFYGTINRHTYALVVQTTGTLSY